MEDVVLCLFCSTKSSLVSQTADRFAFYRVCLAEAVTPFSPFATWAKIIVRADCIMALQNRMDFQKRPVQFKDVLCLTCGKDHFYRFTHISHGHHNAHNALKTQHGPPFIVILSFRLCHMMAERQAFAKNAGWRS